MQRVQLIHWKAEEAEERIERLQAAGYEVAYEIPRGQTFVRALGEDPPAAVIIDLSRLPSQGRDFGVLIRRRKTTRQIPLVFVGGDPDKVARIRELLPDAVYASWEEIGSSIEGAIAHAPAEPVAPRSAFAAYAGRPLPDKLGIEAGTVVGLVGAPGDFRQTLGDLPEGAVLREGADARCDLIIWFTRSRQELADRIEGMAAGLGQGRVWIAWPKKASGVDTDLTQNVVRKAGLDVGLVDYKICAIDSTWSGLLFTRRDQS